MFMGLALILVLLWLAGFIVFHVAGGLIHILLVLALAAFVYHFMTGRNAI